MTGKELSEHPIHLGLGATVETQPYFTGETSWYQDYGARYSDDGMEARLVNLHSFSEPWNMWEMHPNGAEVVLCTEGSITLIQENLDGEPVSTSLSPGQYAITPPGVWHTADVEAKATAVFITAGTGTQHRPR